MLAFHVFVLVWHAIMADSDGSLKRTLCRYKGLLGFCAGHYAVIVLLSDESLSRPFGWLVVTAIRWRNASVLCLNSKHTPCFSFALSESLSKTDVFHSKVATCRYAFLLFLTLLLELLLNPRSSHRLRRSRRPWMRRSLRRLLSCVEGREHLAGGSWSSTRGHSVWNHPTSWYIKQKEKHC